MNSTLSDFLMHQDQHLVLLLDDRFTITQANPLFYAVSEYDSSQLLNQSLDLIIKCDKTLDNEYSVRINSLRAQLNELIMDHRSFSQVVELITVTNTKISRLFSFHPINVSTQNAVHILCIANARQEELLSADIVHQLTYTDQLTGLGNRPFFLKKLDELFIRVERGELSNCLFTAVEFDNFNKVDDLYGYKVGDKLLKKAAQRLQAICTMNDSVFRTSGTKLGILHPVDTIEVANEWAQKILNTLTASYHIEGHCIDISLSMGMVYLPKDASNSVDAIKRVELAFHKAREVSKYSNSILYYPELSEQSTRTLSIEKKLKKALMNDEIEVFYQPQFSLPNRELQGFEALLRWRDLEKGLISPEEFIPIAEKTGLIIDIGKKVLQKACEQSVIWSNKGCNYTMSINISVIQLTDSHFLDNVIEILRKTGVNPYLLEFEITENIFMGNYQESITCLNSLRELGISIALDDFGTGYSSLSYLKEIPLDVLKIDRAFIKNIPKDQKDCAIAKTILTLAKELLIKVVAEGMEKEEQVTFLEQEHCDSAQGFYFSEPLEASEANKLVEQMVN